MANRSRGKRRGLGSHLLVLAVIYVLGYALLTPRYGPAVVVLLGLVVLVWWMLFLMPTWCDFEVQGRGCRRRVNGKLAGCHNHSRAKRDAVFAVFSMRNPGMFFRLLWLDRDERGRALGGGRTGADPAGTAANESQALFNTASLFVAIIGSLAGVLALFAGR